MRKARDMLRLLEAQKYTTAAAVNKPSPWSPSGSALQLGEKTIQAQWEAGRETAVQKKTNI